MGSVGCVEVRDRIDQYQSIEQCELAKDDLMIRYGSELVTCHRGDIIEDDHSSKKAMGV